MDTERVLSDMQTRLANLEALVTKLRLAETPVIPAAPTIPVGANPTAAAGKTANNGSAVTWMRSDASPAIGDSDKTDGFHASATPAAGTIPVSDGSGLLDGWVTANPAAANPATTAGQTVHNGTAATWMRSDATPAIGDSAKVGGLSVDNSGGANAHVVTTDPSGNVKFGGDFNHLGNPASAKVGFFNVGGQTQRSSHGAISAGTSYTTTEQGMLNDVYSALRNYGLLS